MHDERVLVSDVPHCVQTESKEQRRDEYHDKRTNAGHEK